jgi:hypothetical protein
MPPRTRRLLLILTAGAAASRVYVLGRDEGWSVVGPAVVRVTLTALLAWLVHMALHELAHLLAARAERFVIRGVRFAFVSVDLTGPRPRLRLGRDLGGGVSSLPRGSDELGARLRRVALAGPAVSFVAAAALGLAWHLTSQPHLATPLGIFFVMGVFVFATALLPGALLPRRPASGSDLDQLLQPRWVLGHWLNAAGLEAALRGEPIGSAVDWRELGRLLPDDGPVQVFELGFCLAALEAGAVAPARERLEHLARRLDDEVPAWFLTDLFTQRGLVAALHEGDTGLAERCLARVEAAQSLPWYAELLRAALARARGDVAAAERHRQAWEAAADTHPQRATLRVGNGWALAALHTGVTPGAPPVEKAS